MVLFGVLHVSSPIHLTILLAKGVFRLLIHPLHLGSAVPAVGSLTEALKFFIHVQLRLVFSKADKWRVLGGMSPGNLKVGFIYDGSYAGDFYHQRFAQIHEINVSLFSLIGGVLLACACCHWKQ